MVATNEVGVMSISVMVVDDAALIRVQLRRALVEAGFEVLDAVDGHDAWAKIDAGARPSMMICDVNMPRMNGLELLEKLSSAGHMEWLPVLMLTTEGQPELIQRAKALGAKGWIIKPFKADLVVAAARRLAQVGN